jgi:hypothetical protein
MDPHRFDVLIVTAMLDELDAVLALGEDAASFDEMGEAATSARASSLISELDPACLAMYLDPGALRGCDVAGAALPGGEEPAAHPGGVALPVSLRPRSYPRSDRPAQRLPGYPPRNLLQSGSVIAGAKHTVPGLVWILRPRGGPPTQHQRAKAPASALRTRLRGRAVLVAKSSCCG